MLTSSCAQIGQRPPVHQDRLLRTEQVETLSKGVFAKVEQAPNGTDVSIIATRACDLTEQRVLQRTTTVDSFNKQPGTTWFYAGAGLVSAGVGRAFVIDAANTYPNDPNSRLYNKTGPDQERVWGYALVGTGALLGTVAIIDAIRASSSESTESEVTISGNTVRSDFECASHTAGNAVVMVEVSDNLSTTLGVTDPQGRLHVELDQAFSADVVLPPTILPLRIGGVPAGNLDVSAIRAVRRKRA